MTPPLVLCRMLFVTTMFSVAAFALSTGADFEVILLLALLTAPALAYDMQVKKNRPDVYYGSHDLALFSMALDREDLATINAELTRYRRLNDKPCPFEPGPGVSSPTGQIIAEALRSLDEYRSMWEARNPHHTNPSE